MINWPFVIQALSGGGVAAGVLAIVKTIIDRLLGRRQLRVDSAEVVQGMALALITPLEKRLQAADLKVEGLERKVKALEEELDRNVAARRAAEDRLLQYGIPIPAPQGGGS